MREPNLRPSPSAPPWIEPPLPAEPAKPAGPPAPSGVTPPESSALVRKDETIPTRVSRLLRPAENQREVWNRRAGRVDSRPDAKAPRDTTAPIDDSPEERLITAQAPQRPLSPPTFRLEVDGRTVEGKSG